MGKIQTIVTLFVLLSTAAVSHTLKAQTVEDTIFCLSSPVQGCPQKSRLPSGTTVKISNLSEVDGKPTIYFVALVRDAKDSFTNLVILRTGGCYQETKTATFGDKKHPGVLVISLLKQAVNRLRYSFRKILEFFGIEEIVVPVKGADIRVHFIKPNQNIEFLHFYRHVFCPGIVYGIVVDSLGIPFVGLGNVPKQVKITN